MPFISLRPIGAKFKRLDWHQCIEKIKKTRMLLKSFVALALMPELDFEIGMTALCSELSDQSDESPLFDYADYFEST